MLRRGEVLVALDEVTPFGVTGAECRDVALLCLDPALFDCERYTSAADCDVIPVIWPDDSDGWPRFCSWETVVEVTDAASCGLGEARGACIEGRYAGDGCASDWEACVGSTTHVLLRGPPYELMRYDECVGATPPGWEPCSGPDTPAPVCECACAPDFPR